MTPTWLTNMNKTLLVHARRQPSHLWRSGWNPVKPTLFQLLRKYFSRSPVWGYKHQHKDSKTMIKIKKRARILFLQEDGKRGGKRMETRGKQFPFLPPSSSPSLENSSQYWSVLPCPWEKPGSLLPFAPTSPFLKKIPQEIFQQTALHCVHV